MDLIKQDVANYIEKGKSSYDCAFNSFSRGLKEYEEKLYEAWKEHERLWEQTIADLYNGVVNNITQGIWLSYPKVYIEKIGYKNNLLVAFSSSPSTINGVEVLLHKDLMKG